jgi:membrane protease YdiL (CAAX protease family)
MVMTQPVHLPVAIAVLLLALLFRVIDIFVLNLDERWGEILLSKTLTLVLVLGAVVMAGCGLHALGLRGTGIGSTMTVAMLGYTVIFGFALAIQVVVLRLQGIEFSLSFEAIDPKTALSGGLGFALVLFLGNIINALAEEGLFRGLLLPVFAVRLGLWQALALQAVFFGVWHLVWPIKAAYVKETTINAAFTSGLALFVASTVAGVAFGLMYYITQTLWAPVAVHFLNNGFYNFVHIRSKAGVDKHVLILQAVATLGLLALVPLLLKAT